jgi:hypothetical protein
MTGRKQIVLGLVTDAPLSEVAGAVERALGVSLRARSSGYFGGEHFRGGAPAQEEVYLHRNLGPPPERGQPRGLAYPEAAGCPLILRIDVTDRSAGTVARALEAAGGLQTVWMRERAIGPVQRP